MAKETVTKQPSMKERIAARQQKRAEIGKEAKVRTACAFTIAKSLLPNAPVEIQKKFASILIQAPTKVLTASLRQTAINSHWTKVAETLQSVHKMDMNDLMAKASELTTEQNAVKSELKGDAKSANSKQADDRKDAGPQPSKYDEGNRKEPQRMDADNAGERKADTVDKTEGGEKIEDAVQDSARAEVTGKKSAGKVADISTGAAPAGVSSSPAPVGGSPAPKLAPTKSAVSPVQSGKAEISASAKKACGKDCEGCDSCKKESSSEKEANFGVDGKPNSGEVLQSKNQTASAKKAGPGVMDAPPAEAPAAPPAEGMAPEGAPMPEPAPEGAAGDLVQEDSKEILKEKVQEAAQAVQAIEQEISKEEAEEVDLTGIGENPEEMGEMGEMVPEGELSEEEINGMGGGQHEPMFASLDVQNIFSSEAMEDKVSNLANEHTAAEDDFFGPSPASEMEASLDDATFASLDEMFSTTASADPMSSLFITASNVEGTEVLNSQSDLANHFKAEHGKDNRDNESDHDNDILSLLVEGLDEQSDGQERVPQDSSPKLEKPAEKTSAAKKTAGLKHIKATAPTTTQAVNLVDSLFASIDAAEEDRNSSYGGRR